MKDDVEKVARKLTKALLVSVSWRFQKMTLKALLAAVLLTVPLSLAGRAFDQQAREDIERALRGRGCNWAPGAVEEVTEAIMSLQTELGVQYTPDQIRDIAKGLSDESYLQEASDVMHPLLQERNKLRMIHAVRVYVAEGLVDVRERERGRSQILSVLEEHRSQVLEVFPDNAGDIDAGFVRGWESMERHSDNPLRVDYMLSVPDAEIIDHEQYWQDLLDSFALPVDSSQEERITACMALFQSAVAPLLVSAETRRSVSPELAAAEEALSARSSEVSEYGRLAFRKKIRDQEELSSGQNRPRPKTGRNISSEFAEVVAVLGEIEEDRMANAEPAMARKVREGDISEAPRPEEKQAGRGGHAPVVVWGTVVILLLSCATLLWMRVRKRH